MDFDFQPTLSGTNIVVRPLKSDDLDGLYQSASDPLIWASHPCRNRHERAIFEPYFESLLTSRSAVVVVERQSGTIIGCSRYYVAPTKDLELSIGYTFLNRSHWGGGTNLELKRLMLDHIFATQSEAWFHIAPDNIRSQKATGKLGAVFVREEVLDLGVGDALCLTYRIRKSDWADGMHPHDKDLMRSIDIHLAEKLVW